MSGNASPPPPALFHGGVRAFQEGKALLATPADVVPV
jgi:hypothetical protein